MNFSTAKLIVETLEANNRRLWELLPVLEATCEPKELESFKREIGRAIVGIDQHFYPLVLSQYPELNPLKGNGEKNGLNNATHTISKPMPEAVPLLPQS